MNANDLFNRRDQFYLKGRPLVVGLVVASLLIGAGLLGFSFTKFEGRTVWGAFLFNLYFFFCLGLGGMAMSATQDVIGAIWARPVRRIWEGFGAFLPVAAIMFLFFMVAIKFNIGDARSVYSWIKDPTIVHHFFGKNVWLSENFFYARVAFILSMMAIITSWQLRNSIRRDMLFVSGNREAAAQAGEEFRVKSNFWSGLILICYGLGITFLGMDVSMSLAPLWFSTLFGGWQFAIMLQTLFATSLLMMFALKNTPIGSVYSRQQFHDMGKLMHGFTVFFAYLTFAHILTYWYGNMPEETEYFIERLHKPWLIFVCIIPIIAFVIPLYSLIFKAAKWTSYVTIPLCLLILVGQWCTNLVVVMPQVTQAGEVYMPLAEIGGFLFFFGLFFGTFIMFGRKVPMVALADPLLPAGMELGAHH